MSIFCSFFSAAVGCTMDDIRYKFDKGLNSVQVSSDVSLPEFKVLGHRQKTIEASLSSGDRMIYLKAELFLVGFLKFRLYFLFTQNVKRKVCNSTTVHRNAFRTWNCFFTSKRGWGGGILGSQSHKSQLFSPPFSTTTRKLLPPGRGGPVRARLRPHPRPPLRPLRHGGLPLLGGLLAGQEGDDEQGRTGDARHHHAAHRKTRRKSLNETPFVPVLVVLEIFL